MYIDTCPACSAESEIIGKQGASATCQCSRCGYLYEIEPGPKWCELLDEFFELRARYPIGSSINIKYEGEDGPIRRGQVIGYKAQRLYDGHPAVRVRLPFYQGVLRFSGPRLAEWNTLPEGEK